MLITVDTGGTKTLVAAFAHNGTPIKQVKFATPRGEEAYISRLLGVLREQYDMADIDGVVIAVPGMVRDNEAIWCTNLGWEGFDVAGAISTAIDRPVWLENDANLAGLAEARALEKMPDFALYITISTGIGTGIIIDGQISKPLGMSEAGHMVIEYDGKMQPWEDFASGSAIKNTYGAYARDIHDPKIWHQVADKMTRGFLALIPLLQPDVIIIGGSIGTYFDQYGATLQKQLRKGLPAHIALPSIQQALHPEEAVIYGCYYYGTAHLDY
jgi:predicted NBD/HSP70 family sugar kinase